MSAISTLPELVCASANPGKVAEISRLLEGRVRLLPRPADVPDVVEDADTLEGNARLKATAICRATGRPAVSDDTGLEVDRLGGAPGVHTARFAGPDADDAANRAALLAALADACDHAGDHARDHAGDRSARFRTVVMVVWPDGRELVCHGVCEGRIAELETGERGFGYDRLFIPDDDPAGPAGPGARTFAQMTDDEKNAISHRGRAFRALLAALDAMNTTDVTDTTD